ncbi:MAG: PAS domain-containing protein [Holophagales bacterium]|nr:PAS domain-containing protein [Holophagales bacterium]
MGLTRQERSPPLPSGLQARGGDGHPAGAEVEPRGRRLQRLSPGRARAARAERDQRPRHRALLLRHDRREDGTPRLPPVHVRTAAPARRPRAGPGTSRERPVSLLQGDRGLRTHLEGRRTTRTGLRGGDPRRGPLAPARGGPRGGRGLPPLRRDPPAGGGPPRRAERKHRTLVEQTPAIVYLDEIGGRWHYLSPKVEQLLGYTPEDFLERRVRWLDCVHEDDRERVSRETRTNLRERASIRLDYRMRTRDGRDIWVRDEAEPTLDRTTGTWLLRGVISDVTDRTRSEIERQALLEIMQGLASTPDPKEFLRLVHEALRRVLYAENFFVLLHDPATGLFESLYWVDQYDADPSRLDLGRDCGAWVFRSGEAVDMTTEVFAGLEARGEAEIVGTSSPSWLGAPLKKGGRCIGVMAVQDYETAGRYTERDRDFLASVAAHVALAIDRQKAQDALAENEALLREAHQIAHVGVWELDPSAWTFSFSDEGCQILGLAPRDGRFGQDEIFSIVHPDDREWVKKAVLDSLSDGGAAEADHRLLLPDGRVRWVKGRWRVELGPKDEATRVTGTVQDLTEQLLVREAKALAEAKEAAESANRAKSVFLASMSHEIRTPMNSILGFSQLLLGDPGLPPRHREQIGAIIRSGGHLLDLINDVLEMSRIEAGRTHVETAETDLHALLHDLEATFRLRVREKGLSFDIERPADLPGHVLTDEKKLRQILMNLTGNAVKFTSEGSVRVLVRTEPAEGKELRLLVDVEDTGPGIPDEDLPRLFQRFEQTRVGREASTGTGLGLAISRAFARLMGGDITASNRAGEGSVFRLVLLVSAVESPAPVERVEARRVKGLPGDEARRRILVADDVDENREILRQMLERVGFEVCTASDGAEALRLFSTWQPDLVLMDLRMPGVDGLEATRTIRSHEVSGRVPIVALTASAFEEDRRQVENAGGDGFVGKPFREAELLRTVGRLLRLRYVYEGDPPGPARDLARAEARQIPRPLRDGLRSAVVAADLDRVLGLADELAESHAAAAATVRDLAERFEYDRLLAYLEAGD